MHAQETLTLLVLTGTLKLQKYEEMKTDLIRTERHLLKEMGFICHVEHPHKFIISYLKVLAAPSELMQVAWSLANDRYMKVTAMFIVMCMLSLVFLSVML